MPSGRLARWALGVIGVGLFALALRAASWSELRATFLSLDVAGAALLILVNLAAVFVFASRWWSVLLGLDQTLGLGRVALFRLVGFGISYFTPGPQVGGEPAQVLLLERQGVPRQVAVASVALDRLLELLVNFVFVGLGLGVLVSLGIGEASERLDMLLPLGLAAGVAGSYLVGLWMGYAPATAVTGVLRFQGLQAAARDAEDEAARLLRHRPSFVWAALAATLLGWAVILGEYWLMAWCFGVELTFGNLVLGLFAARLAYLFVLPAGLGVFEAGQVMAWQLMGFSGAMGLSMALLIRGRDTLLGAAGVALAPALLAPRAEPEAAVADTAPEER